jgi:hypothetical protein
LQARQYSSIFWRWSVDSGAPATLERALPKALMEPSDCPLTDGSFEPVRGALFGLFLAVFI